MEEQMAIVHGENAETFEVQGNMVTKLIEPSTGGKEIMAWRGSLLNQAQGQQQSMAVHAEQTL
jgi:hypothetical protein